MENAALNKFGERLDASTVRFERILPGPIERVWSYLVEQEKRARWLCGGETEPKEGGSVEMHFHNSSLSSKPDIEPPWPVKEGQVSEADFEQQHEAEVLMARRFGLVNVAE